MTDSTADGSDRQDRIGPYKLLELLGEGGMGEVWLAEQSDPVHRRVALKVIKLGMDTKQVLARLEAERQALAVMDHPNIARFYDGGATETGRPYFVMELVHGTSLTDYCDTYRLTTDDRIRLFTEICQAVQHAHHKGVVHRDLKPSNVLVGVKDDHPVVKIIDFGIAKALGQELTDRTLVTQMGQIIGTPEYMSPEQAEMSGLDVDTRTDVYSLGVMLYELLVGARPFDLRVRADQAVRHAIRETEVPRPSTRLTSLGGTQDTVARHRRTTVEALKRELSSDLDWVILKAMEKDRTRRYETANELAQDLERHLRHEPVLARAPSARYRLGKFVKRHRMGVAAGTAVVAALVIGLSLATVGMVRAQRAERRAEQEADAARQVSDFLVELFEVSDPSEARGNTITAREVLDRGAERIEAELAEQPALQGRMMDVMGGVYTSLGLYRDAEPLIQQGLDVRQNALGNDHPDVAESLHRLAWLYRSLRRYDEALPLAEESVRIREAALGPQDPDYAMSLQLLGMVQRDQGDFDAGQRNLERSLEIRERALGPEHLSVSMSLYHLGWLQVRRGDNRRAQELYLRACRIMENELGPESFQTGWCFNDLAAATDNLGEYDSAREYYERALGIFESVLTPDHPNIGALLNNFAGFLARTGDSQGARRTYERALSIREAAFGPDHPTTAEALTNLGLQLQYDGEYNEARRLYERALRINETAFGPESGGVAGTLNNLGYLLRYVGEFEEARSHLTRCLRIQEETLGPEHPGLTQVLSNLGFLFRDLRQYGEAIANLERAVEITEDAWGPDHVRTKTQMLYAVSPMIESGEFERALQTLAQTRGIQTDDPDRQYEFFWRIPWEEARIRLGMGDRAAADSLFHAALELFGQRNGEESDVFAEMQARFWAMKGDQAQSLEWFKESLRRGRRDPWLLRNPELDLIRSHPEYEALADQIRAELRG
jgi:non-specific serine/threonine protein kinase/serine/threonine-protein kinase